MNCNEGEGGDSMKTEERREALVYMCGYLPGVSPEKSPVLSLAPVRFPNWKDGGDSWKDVCGGGCGFAMAISECGKLITWGSADDEGQSYLVSGKHGETPEPFPLPTEASLLKAAAGWAHCVSVTEPGDVYSWGWKECVPSGKLIHELAMVGIPQTDTIGNQSSLPAEQVSPMPQGFNLTSGTVSHLDSKRAGEEVAKRRKVSSPKLESETPTGGDDFFTLSPCLVTLGPGVRITSVAAGGRHTLALSDMGQVWGWGYGGEGQLGLGTRVKMVSSPHVIPCIEPSSSGKDRSSAVSQGTKVPGSYVKEIACGGRHSVVVTDAGALLTFGWGLYGQCGQGNTKDQLRPSYVNSLSNSRVKTISAGLWHTLCISVNGRVHAFGGNQFGQLGTGADEAEKTANYLVGGGTSMANLAWAIPWTGTFLLKFLQTVACLKILHVAGGTRYC
ncbi:ultraviolet-B receptor UVR8-like isoform X2 [Prunus avium]|uniref:Ultraviolet-B receptor UVR8-like isoform X2 n=1 Tax=Prunus avium TaxID=42229 RepID=A0A6P5TDR1_PRUAV|nr:ultraviolet-B receptor UVR8-like isoform X2 [Prunus avium]